MAWITPYTDWTSSDRVLPADMNRIAGNLNYLDPASTLKDDYTSNDMVTAAQWSNILDEINKLSLFTGTFFDVMPDGEITASNFNAVESITQSFYDRIEFMLRQNVAQGYANDPIYASAIPDQYVRGV